MAAAQRLPAPQEPIRGCTPATRYRVQLGGGSAGGAPPNRGLAAVTAPSRPSAVTTTYSIPAAAPTAAPDDGAASAAKARPAYAPTPAPAASVPVADPGSPVSAYAAAAAQLKRAAIDSTDPYGRHGANSSGASGFTTEAAAVDPLEYAYQLSADRVADGSGCHRGAAKAAAQSHCVSSKGGYLGSRGNCA